MSFRRSSEWQGEHSASSQDGPMGVQGALHYSGRFVLCSDGGNTLVDVRIMNATEFHHEEQEAHEGRPGMPVFFLSFFVIFVFFVVLLYLRGSQ
jgi:hypothetical protein